MGDGFAALPVAVRRVHAGDVELLGEIEVATSPHAFWRGIARLAGLPQATDGAVTFRFKTEAGPDRGRWHRHIGTMCMTSDFWARDGLLFEHMAPLTVASRAVLEGGKLRLEPHKIWALGIPLPRLFWPGMETLEWADGDIYRFNVRLTAPIFGAVLAHYRGWLDTA